MLDHFLPPAQFQAMEESFPPMADASMGVRSHKDLHESDKSFQELCDQNSWWNLFRTEVHSRRWWYDQIARMLRNADGQPNPLDQLTTPLDNIPFRATHIEGRGGLSAVTDEVFLYGRMDIGFGLVGYGRENGGRGVHIDMPQRIVSGLLYFTDQSELEGGQLEVYQADGKTLARTIDVRPNRAVLSFQSKGAYHAVRPVLKLNGIEARRSVYFALSCSEPIWVER